MDVAMTLRGGGLVLGAYLVGSIPWGFLIGRLNGIDIRQQGSGNIGATNVRRVLGRKWGAFCLALDSIKGLAPVLLATHLMPAADATSQSIPVLAAGATVAGHVWPFSLGFKGGKGVATAVGAVVALAPWVIIATTLCWLAVFYSSKYVSLASVCAAAAMPLSGLVERLIRRTAPPTPTLLLLVLLAILIIVRHRSNIARLIKGTEYRFGAAPKPTAGATLPPAG